MEAKTREQIIKDKRSTTVDNPDFNIVWEDQPSGSFKFYLV